MKVDPIIFRKVLVSFGVFLSVCLIGLFYWYVFATNHETSQGVWGKLYLIVSFSFIFGVPFLMGALTSFLGCLFHKRNWRWIYVAPCCFVGGAMLMSVLFSIEAIFCVIVAAPIMIPLAFVGGLFGAWMHNLGQGRLYISVVVLLPMAVSPLESMWQHPHTEVDVPTQITINAHPDEVWKQIASVSAIETKELPPTWIYWLGFPRPIAAEIDHPGVGGKRWATFERNVSFFEIVTAWEESKTLAFTITADPDFIPHTAFDQHIIVGGRFFDVLDGRYQLEEYDGNTILHLSSRHVLSTPFNQYAGWWSQRIMEAIQNSILQVIRSRAENNTTR